jgi:cell division protein ZapA
MSSKQLEVQIMGQSYLLGCPEGGETQLLAAVSKVDAAMCKIRDAGKIKARDRIAVLAALNLAFDAHDDANQSPTADVLPNTLSPATSSAPLSDADSERLNQLLHRLDQTLGRDGQLI